jgi:hypothetical protein
MNRLFQSKIQTCNPNQRGLTSLLKAQPINREFSSVTNNQEFSMLTTSDIQITLDLRNPHLDDEALEKLTQSLRRELLDLEEVKDVKRLLDPNPPEGNKAFGAVLVGMLTAEVNAKNIKTLFGFLGDRLGNKPIEMEVEANGKKLKIQASSQQELLAAIQAAQQFVATV